jgi:hypothetical protein
VHSIRSQRNKPLQQIILRIQNHTQLLVLTPVTPACSHRSKQIPLQRQSEKSSHTSETAA